MKDCYLSIAYINYPTTFLLLPQSFSLRFINYFDQKDISKEDTFELNFE